ncbi:MAG TPA: hypothetical protein VIL74_02270 [Pyrinomonadaceae bacterium]
MSREKLDRQTKIAARDAENVAQILSGGFSLDGMTFEDENGHQLIEIDLGKNKG